LKEEESKGKIITQKDIFHFTVGQLVEILKSLPQDLPVLTSGYESGFENFYPPSGTHHLVNEVNYVQK
jgi:hypothetical protein